MNKATLEEKLVSLEAEKSRYTRRIERVLPLIEDALAKGVSREAVVAVLQEDGIDVTLNGFATALYRLRKKRDAKRNATSRRFGEERVEAREPDAEGQSKKPPEFSDLSQIARNRPDLGELARLGREAAKEAKAKEAKAKP